MSPAMARVRAGPELGVMAARAAGSAWLALSVAAAAMVVVSAAAGRGLRRHCWEMAYDTARALLVASEKRPLARKCPRF